jgi:Phage integrase family
MRTAGDDAHGRRLRGLIVVLWARRATHPGSPRRRRGRSRSPPRRLARPPRQARTAPRGRHGRMRLGGAAPLARAATRAPGRPAVLHHQPTDPRPALVQCRRPSRAAPERGRGRRPSAFAPHQLRHAHAVELASEGVPLIVIQRQPGHSNLGITSIYPQGIDNGETVGPGAMRSPRARATTEPRRSELSLFDTVSDQAQSPAARLAGSGTSIGPSLGVPIRRGLPNGSRRPQSVP